MISKSWSEISSMAYGFHSRWKIINWHEKSLFGVMSYWNLAPILSTTIIYSRGWIDWSVLDRGLCFISIFHVSNGSKRCCFRFFDFFDLWKSTKANKMATIYEVCYLSLFSWLFSGFAFIFLWYLRSINIKKSLITWILSSWYY